VARAQVYGSTYVYFEILFVCGLAWEKSVTVVDVFVVDAIRWNRGRRSVTCSRALGELVGLIVKW